MDGQLLIFPFLLLDNVFTDKLKLLLVHIPDEGCSDRNLVLKKGTSCIKQDSVQGHLAFNQVVQSTFAACHTPV